MNLNKLIDFAKYYGVSLTIKYWESDDTYSIEIVSQAKEENYYEKRVYDLNNFIDNWENKAIKSDMKKFSELKKEIIYCRK